MTYSIVKRLKTSCYHDHASFLHSPCFATNLIYTPPPAATPTTNTTMAHPPGYRFYPTEEELVSFYLPNELEGQRDDLHRVIPVVNIYQHEPWHLPKEAGELCTGDTEQWFFFVPKQEKEVKGGRPSRATGTGYWKATGSPTYVYSSSNKVIGLKKTMVFYHGKSSGGKKTKWKMNEYRAIKEELDATKKYSVPKVQHELSLCRVYVVSGTVRAFDRRPLGLGTYEIGSSSSLSS